jgi:hypothetical protein
MRSIYGSFTRKTKKPLTGLAENRNAQKQPGRSTILQTGRFFHFNDLPPHKLKTDDVRDSDQTLVCQFCAITGIKSSKSEAHLGKKR